MGRLLAHRRRLVAVGRPWVGIPIASVVVLGDVWRALNPFDRLAALAGWARARGRELAGPRRDDPPGSSPPRAAVP